MPIVEVATRFLEDDPPQERRKQPKRKPVSLLDWAQEHGLNDDTLALQIDRSLDSTVWRGTRFVDRAQHFANTLDKTIVGEMEKSLLAQESFRDFETRMLQKLGVSNLREPAGPLRDMEIQLEAEARIAWNQGMLALQPQGVNADTALFWRSALIATTTQHCADNHGRLISELGEMPLAHIGCLCDAIQGPNPDSPDPEIAAEGRLFVETMAAERAAWQPMKESRLPLVRWAQDRRREPGGYLHPAWFVEVPL